MSWHRIVQPLRGAQPGLVKLSVALALVGSFLFCVYQVAALDVLGTGLWTSGGPLVRHQVSKVVLALHLLLILMTCGELALAGLRLYLGGGPMRPMARLVCAGYLGASLLALVMLLLGFANAYSRSTALVLTVPLLAAAPFVLADLAGALAVQVRAYTGSLTRPQRLVALLAGGAVVGTVAVLIVNKVIFPESMDNDVWEHYLHYYREVTQRGGIGPNDVWYHFYLSKGAGLFFLAVLLSDTLGAALVSFCFVVLSAVVVFDLLHRRTRDPLWGVLGVLLLFLFMLRLSPDVASFSKHHVPIMAYLALALWCLLQRGGETTEQRPLERTCIGLTGALGTFYLGFYVPPAAAILLASVLLFAGCQVLLDRRGFDARRVLGLSVACVGGVTAALAVNYAVTGLAEMTPLRTMWSLADQTRFEHTWSRYQVEYYFLGADSQSPHALDLPSLLRSAPGWINALCRGDYFSPYLGKAIHNLTALVLLLAAFSRSSLLTSFRASFTPTRGRVVFLCEVAAYLLGALLVAQAFPGTDTLKRMYSFTALFIVLGIAAGASALMGPWSPSRSWGGAVALLVCVWLPAKTALTTAWPDALRYARGRITTAQALTGVQASMNLRWGRATYLGYFAFAQRLIPPEQRWLHLSYDAGPAYLLGGRPILTRAVLCLPGSLCRVVVRVCRARPGHPGRTPRHSRQLQPGQQAVSWTPLLPPVYGRESAATLRAGLERRRVLPAATQGPAHPVGTPGRAGPGAGTPAKSDPQPVLSGRIHSPAERGGRPLGGPPRYGFPPEFSPAGTRAGPDPAAS